MAAVELLTGNQVASSEQEDYIKAEECNKRPKKCVRDKFAL